MNASRNFAVRRSVHTMKIDRKQKVVAPARFPHLFEKHPVYTVEVSFVAKDVNMLLKKQQQCMLTETGFIACSRRSPLAALYVARQLIRRVFPGQRIDGSVTHGQGDVVVAELPQIQIDLYNQQRDKGDGIPDRPSINSKQVQVAWISFYRDRLKALWEKSAALLMEKLGASPPEPDKRHPVTPLETIDKYEDPAETPSPTRTRRPRKRLPERPAE
jgi:hypothetical protein